MPPPPPILLHIRQWVHMLFFYIYVTKIVALTYHGFIYCFVTQQFWFCFVLFQYLYHIKTMTNRKKNMYKNTLFIYKTSRGGGGLLARLHLVKRIYVIFEFYRQLASEYYIFIQKCVDNLGIMQKKKHAQFWSECISPLKPI